MNNEFYELGIYFTLVKKRGETFNQNMRWIFYFENSSKCESKKLFQHDYFLKELNFI
jgi:hypothetical protein